VVSAEDTTIGNPDLEIYLVALARVNDKFRDEVPIAPEECLVIEDSRAGLQAVHRAGTKAAAIETIYPAEQLCEADLVLKRLDAQPLVTFEQLFRTSQPGGRASPHLGGEQREA
jgi:beta-phosphoglucomutase-like phosphatase (HAD superfamily)